MISIRHKLQHEHTINDRGDGAQGSKNMNFLENTRIRTTGWAFVIALLIAGGVFAASSLITVNNISAVQKTWSRFEEHRSYKAGALSALRKEIGYGGMIHQFKNFILRHDKNGIGVVNAKLGGAASAIARYRALGLNEVELKAIVDVERTLDSYAEALSHAAALTATGATSAEIDTQVRIDDTAALRGLDALDEEVTKLSDGGAGRPSKSQAVATLRKAMGYGGMIHNFKNAILRHDHQALKLTLKGIAAARKALGLYSERSLSTTERQAIANISGVLTAYETASAQIEKLAGQGQTAAAIDNIVRIDDTPALNGFNTLIREIAQQNRQEAARVDNALALVASVAKSSALVTLVLIALLAATSLWILQNRIINPIAHITRIMSRLAEGNLDLEIDAAGQNNEIGEMARAVEIFRNTAIDRAKADLALKESGERMEAVVDHIFDGIFIIDQLGTIQSVNPAAVNIFDYSEGELIGRNVRILMPEPHHSAHDGYLSDYVTTGKSGIIGIGREVEGVRRDGSGFPLHLQIADLHLSAGRFFLGVVRDLTEQKEADRAKGEFVSTVSHELRTPLTSIKGSLGLIRSGAIGTLPEKLRSMLDIAYKNSDRLVLLINDILDMEKIKAGKMDYQMLPTEIVSLVDEAIEANEGYGEEHNVTFVKLTTEKEALVHGDKDRLMQVLSNLMSNAAKFSPDGEQVEMSIGRHDGMVRIAVKDNGPGIPEKFKKAIFQKFSQADSSDTRQKGGTGLGLSITKAIVEQHGGSIGFESEVGKGSNFFFDLPELTEQNEQLERRETAPPKAGGNGHHKILICEDEPDIVAILEKTLENTGYITSVATTADEAKRMLEESEYSAMTLDLGLPDRDGLSLLRDLRKTEKLRDLPVIVVSATPREGEAELIGESVGVHNWLEKPIDSSRLIELIGDAVKPASNGKPRILHVENDDSILQVVSALVADTADIVSAASMGEAINLIEAETYDLVILDLMLPDGDGETLLPLLSKPGAPATPVIVFSAKDVSGEAVDGIEATLVKSQTTNDKLLATIRAAIEPGPRPSTAPRR